MKQWFSPYQFTFFRILFGAYLFFHFISLIPDGTEVFSNMGMLSDSTLNATYYLFPNLFSYWSEPWMIQFTLLTLAFFSLIYGIGYYRRLAAIILWYGWACLFNRNLMISNPSLSFVGWLLLASSLIPEGEPWTLRSKSAPSISNWEFPPILFFGAWWIMAVSYSVSGLHKLTAPSWQDGTALSQILTIPLARDYFFVNFLSGLPSWILKIMSWGALSLEILFLPLCLFQFTRKWAWLAMVGLHLGILSVIHFTDLTLGMIMFHLFTFDSRWMQPKSQSLASPTSPIVFYDGLCGLCDKTVQFLLTEDRYQVLRFASLQSETAKIHLIKYRDLIQNPQTIVLKTGNKFFFQSDAVIRSVISLGGIWSIAYIFLIIPKKIRDFGYAFVSSNRYRWFGKFETCRIASAQERFRFLP